MIEVRAAHPVAPADLDAIRALHASVAAADGHDALGESVWRDLERGGRPGSAGAYATDAGTLVGFVHVAPAENASDPHWEAGIVVDATHHGTPLVTDLLRAVVAHATGDPAGHGPVVLWVFAEGERADPTVTAAGFTPSRDLLRMEVTLPIADPARWPDGVHARAFRPGADDDAWLAVNNGAFHDHPEQGGWTAAALAARVAEPWFDADGFLLAVTGTEGDDPGDDVVGFCWTKVHPAGTDDAGRGEIFVIGVAPGRQGGGLGRALVVAGLASLADRGVTHGLLYVDGANTAAVRLYESLGFAVARRDRAYEHP